MPEIPLDSLAILIPVALLLSGVIIGAFIWAVKADQFEDLERHGQDVFFDPERPDSDATPVPAPNRGEGYVQDGGGEGSTGGESSKGSERHG